MELEPQVLTRIWESQAKWRKSAQKRRRYVEGNHDILAREETYADGSRKTNRVANWIGYVTRRFTGALTSIPYQITAKDDPIDVDTEPDTATEGETEAEPETANESPEIYTELSEANALPIVDVQNFKNAFITGRGIELHEVVEDEYVIRDVDPVDWALLYDSLDNLVGAINVFRLVVGDIHEGKVLEADLPVMVHYTDAQIVTFEFADEANAWVKNEEVSHEFGAVPIVVWRLNKEQDSFLTDAILGQNDEYNETDSASGDDIRNDSDSILLLPGVDGDWIKENSEAIRKTRILPWDSSDQATEPKYLIRGNDVARTESRLDRTKMHIHAMADVPDVEQIVGATGVSSGIALKLKFLPMLETSAEMINWLKSGVRDRIDMFNAIRDKQRKPKIEDVSVHIQFSLPVSRLEEWEKISSLDGIVSHRTQLELLSDVDDPEKELKRIEAEGPRLPEGEGGEQGEVSSIQQALDQQILSGQLQDVINPLMQSILEEVGAAASAFVVSTGAADAQVAASRSTS